jgi:hypothetical protein
MASAQVREANERTGKLVMLGNGKNYFRNQEIFANNPRMASPEEECVWVANYPGNRPYVKEHKNKNLTFNDDFKPEPGELWFSEIELDWCEKHVPEYGYIVVEPKVKTEFVYAINKAWPYWEELAKVSHSWVELGPDEGGIFPRIRTKTFREAMLILSRATAFVGTDGGLHHAAAALGIPAVVIWTGFSSPKHLGYDFHINIHDGSKPCGFIGGICPHCREIAAKITPEQVLAGVEQLVNSVRV